MPLKNNLCTIGPQRLSGDVVAIRTGQNSANKKYSAARQPSYIEFSAPDKTKQVHTQEVLGMILLCGREQIRCSNPAPGLITRDHQRPRLILIQVIAKSDLHAQPFYSAPPSREERGQKYLCLQPVDIQPLGVNPDWLGKFLAQPIRTSARSAACRLGILPLPAAIAGTGAHLV
ncbi:MAG TPA: hypothetical protein VEI95_03995 [Acidobacteriota bacterium]|nr:hypothetical protein [Acidobacteriota bacterium]